MGIIVSIIIIAVVLAGMYTSYLIKAIRAADEWAATCNRMKASCCFGALIFLLFIFLFMMSN